VAAWARQLLAGALGWAVWVCRGGMAAWGGGGFGGGWWRLFGGGWRSRAAGNVQEMEKNDSFLQQSEQTAGSLMRLNRSNLTRPIRSGTVFGGPGRRLSLSTLAGGQPCSPGPLAPVPAVYRLAFGPSQLLLVQWVDVYRPGAGFPGCRRIDSVWISCAPCA